MYLFLYVRLSSDIFSTPAIGLPITIYSGTSRTVYITYRPFEKVPAVNYTTRTNCFNLLVFVEGIHYFGWRKQTKMHVRVYMMLCFCAFFS